MQLRVVTPGELSWHPWSWVMSQGSTGNVLYQGGHTWGTGEAAQPQMTYPGKNRFQRSGWAHKGIEEIFWIKVDIPVLAQLLTDTHFPIIRHTNCLGQHYF